MPKSPKPRKKQTALQKEYAKERRRILRFMREAEKRGFMFDKSDYQQPKRVTKKAVAKLKATRPADLYKKAMYVDPTTGEFTKAEVGRKLERQRAARKGIEERKRRLDTKIPYEGSPREENIGFDRLTQIINNAYESGGLYKLHSVIAANAVSRFANQFGRKSLLSYFSTPEGEYAVIECEKAIAESSDEAIRRWTLALESALHQWGVLSDEEVRELQDREDESTEDYLFQY